MTHQHGKITIQIVPDQLIAGFRFHGGYDAIPAHFDRLVAQVGARASGPAMCLYHGQDPTLGTDIEVCCPVAAPLAGPVDEDGVTSHLLPGGQLLTITHVGPYEAMRDSYQALYRYAGQRGIGLTMGPSREVYLESEAEHGDDASRYVTLIMHPVLVSAWLDRLADGLGRHAGEAARQTVMAGSEVITLDTSAEAYVDWLQGAMARLDGAVSDDGTRCAIMTGCSHVFPQIRIDHLKAEFERLGRDIDALLPLMHADPHRWYEEPRREGRTIFVSKDPYDRQAFQAAADPVEKRAAYCHCPMLKAAIRAQTPISPTYCHCGGGWYLRLWEGILGQPVRVEQLETVLQGADRCAFAIHLPEGIV